MRVEHWPHEAITREKGVTTFVGLPATIKKCIVGKQGTKNEGRFFGWTFTEDTTPNGEYKGVIWGPPQAWNDAEQGYDPYQGPRFREGQRVEVYLAMSEKGEQLFCKVKDIVSTSDKGQDEPPVLDAGAPPQGAIGPQDPVPAKWTMPREFYEAQERTTRASIERQTAVKCLTDLACAALDVISTDEKERAQTFTLVQQARDWANELWSGEAQPQTEESQS